MPDPAESMANAIRQHTDESVLHIVSQTREDEMDLMRQAQAGHREAYGTLYQRLAPAIWQMAYLILHNADAAEDVVQETFTRGLEHIASFQGKSGPKAWLCSIALNVCRQAIRKRNMRETTAETAALEEGRPHGPVRRGVLTSLLRHETSRRMAIALGFLTQEQREVFVLHYMEALPYEEIAEILQTTAGAARALSHRARVILQSKLKEDALKTPGPQR
ncbi:MAG: RNA polymerase sigma factor [Planctomycetes bacterium]|nr:RNA polymerase sigma factor [Planctomycetota bacterium]